MVTPQTPAGMKLGQPLSKEVEGWIQDQLRHWTEPDLGRSRSGVGARLNPTTENVGRGLTCGGTCLSSGSPALCFLCCVLKRSPVLTYEHTSFHVQSPSYLFFLFPPDPPPNTVSHTTGSREDRAEKPGCGCQGTWQCVSFLVVFVGCFIM